jgi:rSAM/selenodomain-associated transferase 2
MSVSIIIPTLNEAASIAVTIARLRRQRPQEIIVVDGGSSDNTRELARGADHVLIAPPSRAGQMNAGAAIASGRHLLFWHADCTLQAGGLAALDRVLLHRNDVSAGCFSMRVRAAHTKYRLIDGCASARVRLTGIVYGDQGLFVRRDDFAALGGFPPVKFFEDVLFSQRLRRRGRVVLLPQRIFVSPRRWQKVGVVRQTLRNWSLTAFALAGVSPDRLAVLYPQVR